MVQQAWIRLQGTQATIDNLPGWLTTVTARLCLDRLRSRTPELRDDVEPAMTAPDPADDVALADTVGVALQVVLDRLTPRERAGRLRPARQLRLRVRHDRPGARHLLDRCPQARLARPRQGRPAGTGGHGRDRHPRRDQRPAGGRGLLQRCGASALPVLVERRPGAAWFDRGVARVVFDFTVTDGRVSRIDFRAAPEVLEQVRRRRGGEPRTRPEG